MWKTGDEGVVGDEPGAPRTIRRAILTICSRIAL
jgi:hypothetical protein